MFDKIEDIIEDAGKVPLTSKIMLDKEEILEVISDIRLKFPEELKRANWLNKERQRILTESQEEANQIREKAVKHQENLVNDTEVVKLAHERAEQILKTAEEKANELKMGSLKYCDNLLASLQEKIVNVHGVLEENKKELNNLK